MPVFTNKRGVSLGGVSLTLFNEILEKGYAHGLLPAQTTEAASYSFAMVARYALGLSAAGGHICALCGDTLASEIALGTLRHLVVGGAKGVVHHITEQSKRPGVIRELSILQKLGVTIDYSSDNFAALLANSHAVLCGLFGATIPEGIIEMLNDHQVPIHSVQAPIGLNVENGTPGADTLFSSSTLSLGIPLVGLHAGKEYVGRHYICDISISPELYMAVGAQNAGLLFAEQPVVQIYPE